MSTTQVQAQVTYTWGELVRVNFQRARYALFMPFASSVITYLLTRATFSSEEDMRGFVVGPWIVIFAVFGFFSLWWLMKAIKSRRDPRLRDMSYLFTFTEERISVESTDSSSSLAWKLISSVTETKQDFHFKRQLQTHFFLPKRAFATASDLALVRQLLRAKLGKKATLRND